MQILHGLPHEFSMMLYHLFHHHDCNIPQLHISQLTDLFFSFLWIWTC